jgi:hypothetical protein
MRTPPRAVHSALPTTTTNDDRFERGTTALEAVFVIPVLLYLVFGAFGIVGAVRDHATLADAVRAGGRTAAVAGADPSADQRVLAELARATRDLGSAQVDVVVIWHAAGPGETLPAGCGLSGSVPNATSLGVSDGGIDAVGACNVYLRPAAPGGAFAKATGNAAQPPSWYFGCQGDADPEASHKLDCRWPAKDRRTATSSREAGTPLPPDFVGVHVVVEHQVTTIAPHTTIHLTQDVINLIEPTRYET